MAEDIECDVDGCTYRNRPSATSWVYHYVSDHGATFGEAETLPGGLVIP